MFCQHCGTKIEDSAAFCSGCGNKVATANTQPAPAPEAQNSPFMNTPAPEVQSSPFMNTPAPEVQSSPFMNTPAPEVQSSPFMNTPAPEVQNSPFMNTPAPEVQNSPFMNTPAPEVQSSPFMNTPAPEVQSSPFMNTPAPEVQSSPFMNTPAPEAQNSPFMNTPVPAAQREPAAKPFASGNNQQAAEVQKKGIASKQKKEKKAKENKAEKKSENDQSSKIAIMILAQVVFVVIICYMGFTGKFNNSLGEINIAYTILALIVVMAINLVLYVLLFTGKKKTAIVVPPPIEKPRTNVGKAPTYMSDIIKDNNVGIPDVDSVEEEDCPTEVCSLPEDNGDDATEVIFEAPVLKFPKLEYVEDGVTKEVLINKNEFIIGRLRGRVDFITTNKKIGRLHAAIVSRDGAYFVKDFNSQNKTYINRGGAIVPEQEYEIKNNDVISFADSEFVFKLPE